MEKTTIRNTKLYKITKWTIIVCFVVFSCLWIANNYYYGIAIKSTFSTSYGKTSDNRFFIETTTLYIETPNRWIHIAEKSGHLGYVGYFYTKHGNLYYYYDRLPVDFKKDSETPKGFRQLETYGNDYKIEFHDGKKWNYYSIIFEDEKRAGFQIPQQDNMTFSLTFYPSNAGYEYFDDMHEIINSMEFLPLPHLEEILELIRNQIE